MPFLSHRSISFLLLVLNGVILSSNLCSGHGVEKSDSCPFSGHGSHDHEHHHAHHHHGHGEVLFRSKLPEELAEEEDLGLSGLDSRHSHKGHVLSGDHQLSKLDLWIQAMGCSLLVSMASLICLMILPVILLKGKPSKTMVDSLAAFGAGAMLGDAFLHQLPHAFGGGHLHSHDHHLDDLHDSVHDHGHSLTHSHSLEDLSVGLSILSGIVLFLLVEKIVRYVEDLSGKGADEWSLGHHHHRKNINKLKDDDRCDDNPNAPLIEQKDGNVSEMASDKNLLDTSSDDPLNDEKHHEKGAILRKRRTFSDATGGSKDDANGSIRKMTPMPAKEPSVSSSSVFGYLNLFSDGVHNFTDGMALGSAFLLYGSVGGWSRTVFLLAHELPQEVGDFGILVRSGFSVSKALFFNFLSALVALAGTALALIIGQDPGQSSLLEGFTAGGFIYIAVAGVLPELNSVNTTLKNSVIHLLSLILGMAVALWISLVE